MLGVSNDLLLICCLTAHPSDHPLALYVFSQDAAFKAKGVLLSFSKHTRLSVAVFDNTQSGSAVANDTMLQCGGKW